MLAQCQAALIAPRVANVRRTSATKVKSQARRVAFAAAADAPEPGSSAKGMGKNLPAAMDIDAIMNLLPHRYPFLLVDRVVEIEVGSYAIGVKNVTINDNFFPGHFPQRPIMPGVLMVEAMAQVGGLVMLEPGEEGEIRFKRARVGWRTNRSPRRLAALVIRIDEATHRRSAHE